MTGKTERPPAKTTRQPPTVTLKGGIGEEPLGIDCSGDFELLMTALGNPAVAHQVICGASVLGSHGRRIDQEATSFVLGFLDSMKPRDAAEGLLLCQMAAVHNATMMMARRLNHVSNLPQQDSAERAVNKLARTFSMQMESLKRYRTGGKQVVRVERVTVEAGGQAVVGDVHHRGRGHDETRR